MAANIKGLTVEIGGDTTKLGKALEDVNKKSRDLSGELGQINKLLRMDPGNADLLAQKQQVLAEAVTNTAKKLDTLKEAERQVQAQFERGEVSEEQVRALQREIVATTNKLKGYEDAARETAAALDDVGEEAEDAADAGDELSSSFGEVASKGFKAVSAAAVAAVGALVAAAESSREYRTEMGKLNTAFEQQGFSSEAATNAYRDLVGVLGETDQSVEAANHLAKLTDNEKDLAAWTGDILPGVFATFGDSLPIEGLTEAANETAKVGQVTGPLADAINWATAESDAWSAALSGNAKAQAAFEAATKEGASAEDAFNAALAECSTEQERQQLITQALTSIYGDASAAYKETNADVIAANQAADAWNASLAQVGAVIEPVLTKVKELGAELLSTLVPIIQGLIDNLPVVATIMAGTTAAFVAFKVAALAATAAQKGMTLAQYAAAAAQTVLNAVMAANPIGLIILAITGLVAAFLYLWNNCESFREFWIGLWEKIKEVVSTAVEFFKTLPEKIYSAIVGAIDRVKQWGSDLVANVKTAATNMLTGAVTILRNMPGNILTAISAAITNVVKWGADMVAKAKAAATNFLNGVFDILKNIPGKVTSAISAAISNVVKWGSDMVAKAKSGMQNVVSTVTSTLGELPGKVFSIGSNLVTGLWNGINDKFKWLIGKIKSFTSSVMDKIAGFFGVESPSKKTAWIGDMLDQGLAKGVIKNANTPIKAMQKVAGGVLDAATGDLNGISLERSLNSSAALTTQPGGAAGGGILDKLDSILTAIKAGQIIAIDGDLLVGATAEKFDKKLGQRRVLAARGAI